MLCCVEIGCLVWGIIILATGKVSLSASKEVRGAPAYIIGLLLLAVFPLALGIGFVIGFRQAQQGGGPQFGRFDWSVVLIDLGAILVCVIPALIIALAAAKPKRRKKKRRRSIEEEDYDDYDRPIRRRRLDEEEEEEEERAGRPKRRLDEDEDDVPRRRRRVDEDEDDDHERPRRRRRDDDD